MSVDEFIKQRPENEKGLRILRGILLDLELTEAVKWNFPVYTIDNKNIIGLGSFQSYFGLWFYQGIFLKDKHKVLINAQEGKTKAMRQWRFQPDEHLEISLIKEYIKEAIDNHNKGLELKPQKRDLVIPHELELLLETEKSLGEAFGNLNLTLKREFCNYINTAKQDATKQKRLEKIKPLILSGISLNEKYR